MSSYGIFAQFYDELTNNVDYEVRSDYISNFFYENNIISGRILDLACGTGSMSLYFKKKGFDVTGVDLSQGMLSVADSKACGTIQFIKGDMTNFSFDNKFDGCICCLDSINHLDSIKKVEACFNCVANTLKPGGLFVFDVNTIYKHNEILADNTFVFDEEDYFLSWDNENMGDDTVRILLDFFVFNGESYDRFSEEFLEKAYSVELLKSVLIDFDVIGVYDELKLNAPREDSERLYFVCKRK